jgi:hypothetical protein
MLLLPRTDRSQNQTIHQKLHLSEQNFEWIHTFTIALICYTSTKNFPLHSLSFWLHLPGADCTCLASYWRSGKLQLTNNVPPPHNSLFLTTHLPTPFLPIKPALLTTFLRNPPFSNSSLAPFFRLTKPPHPPSFQTDIFHNCSSIPSHNSAPPIGLHAHLVAAFTQASLHSITHTHTPSRAPHVVVMQR